MKVQLSNVFELCWKVQVGGGFLCSRHMTVQAG